METRSPASLWKELVHMSSAPLFVVALVFVFVYLFIWFFCHCHWRNRPPDCLTLIANWACIHESYRIVANKETLFKCLYTPCLYTLIIYPQASYRQKYPSSSFYLPVGLTTYFSRYFLGCLVCNQYPGLHLRYYEPILWDTDGILHIINYWGPLRTKMWSITEV